MPIWLETVRGGYPDLSFFGLSGIEQVRGFVAGHTPRPPISHLTGMIPVEAGPGLTTFTMPASPWLVSPTGVILGGALAILADGPLGCAVQTTLSPATPYTTAELSMHFLRPATPESGTLTARGTLIHAGRSLALTQVAIEDSRGRLLAFGTSRCMILPSISPAPTPPNAPTRVEETQYDTLDPYLRENPGAIVSDDAWASKTGLDVLRACITGDLPAPPIHHLTGLKPTDANEGRSTFVLPSSGWLCSPLGRVEGGTIAMIADSAISSAIQTTLPEKTAYASIDLKVTFTRPVMPDGRDLTAHGTVIHRGRRLATASAVVLNADGKQVATAVGSSMILPGRMPSLVQAPVDEPQIED